MFSELRADLRHYNRFCYQGRPVWRFLARVLARILYLHPAALPVIWYRFGSAAWRMGFPFVRQLSQLVYLIGMPFVRIYSGVQIQSQTKIGPGLTILHFGGVVITRDYTIAAIASCTTTSVS
jgi:serine acetyltransferase